MNANGRCHVRKALLNIVFKMEFSFSTLLSLLTHTTSHHICVAIR